MNRIDKGAHVLRIHVLMHTMSKVGNVVLGTESLQHRLHTILQIILIKKMIQNVGIELVKDKQTFEHKILNICMHF